MKDALHTPAPWHRNIPPLEKYPTIFSGRNTHVAQVITMGLGTVEARANAALILAAPDLLAVAIRAKAWIEEQMLENGWPPERVKNPPEGSHLHALATVIAKATEILP